MVYVATYAYFLLALVGYQELRSEPEMFFPFFLVLKFTFFIGLLKVSIEHLRNDQMSKFKVASAINYPFGDDEDDFQIGELISRHVWVSRAKLYRIFNFTFLSRPLERFCPSTRGPRCPPTGSPRWTPWSPSTP